MDINRNQYFMVGVIALLLGFQFRIVESYELTDSATRFLAERSGSYSVADTATLTRKVIQPPEWSGWCLLSIGGVLILHSLALRRPD